MRGSLCRSTYEFVALLGFLHRVGRLLDSAGIKIETCRDLRECSLKRKTSLASFLTKIPHGLAAETRDALGHQ